MATIRPTFLSTGDPDVVVAAWLNLTEADTAAPIAAGAYSDRSVQVAASVSGGTFGTLGHCIFEGSNIVPANWATGGRKEVDVAVTVPANYITLTDPLGNALDFTAAGLKQLTELPAVVRPRITGTSVKVDCYLSMRRNR